MFKARIAQTFAVFLISFLVAFPAFAGGINILDVRINNMAIEPNGAPIELFPEEPFELCYRANYYHYTPAQPEEVWVYFDFEPLEGTVAPKNAIENGFADLKFVELIRPRSFKSMSPDSSQRNITECFDWRAPASEGTFQIRYSRKPVIQPVGRVERQKARWMADYESTNSAFGTIAQISTRQDLAEKTPFVAYVKIDGKVPGLNSGRIEGGAREEPLNFSWSVRFVEAGNYQLEFRHRLTPDTENWSDWSSRQDIGFHFLLKGYHVFELEARYREEGSEEWIYPQAGSSFDFFVEKHLAAPRISKSEKGLVRVDDTASGSVDPNWVSSSVYTGSKAFLSGVQYYENNQFAPLVFIDNDMKVMRNTLAQAGFDQIIETPLNGTRGQILDDLQDFFDTVSKGDRVLLYFSMHGFESDTDVSNPYLATFDCNPDRPSTNCIPLKTIEELVIDAVRPEEDGGSGAKHVLVLLDACSVGMGIMRQIGKSSDTAGFIERRLLEAPGAHVMTAGLANQVAIMDTQKEMSVFTAALAEALAGEADYIKDGVLTLREIELYVRHKVALETNAEQTPMVGDIAGAGQIAFIVQPSNK
jgi:hypothetical protein